MPEPHTVDTERDRKNNSPVLDSFWSIALHYGVSFQELKQINKGKGSENGGYSYEKRTPPYWLNDGDIVILPVKQPENQELGDPTTRCTDTVKKEMFLPIKIIKKSFCSRTLKSYINGVEIKIYNDQISQTKRTNDQGSVIFKELSQGNYNVEVIANDFKPIKKTMYALKNNSPYYEIEMIENLDWDITMIPNIMRRKNWIVGAKLMDHWFSRVSYTYPNLTNLDSVDVHYNDEIVSLKWALNFPRAKNVYDEMWDEKIYVNSAAKKEIEKILKKQNKFDKSQQTTFGNLSASIALINATTYIQNRVVENGYFQDIDDMVAGLANFSFRMAVEGNVKFKENRETYFGFGDDVEVYEVQIKKVGIYIRDSYDFIGSQPLGYWNPDSNEVWTTNFWSKDGFHEVNNSIFRQWRNKNGCGGDFIVFSDIEIRTVDESWEVEIEI